MHLTRQKLRIEGWFLRSRVARRVFLLYVLSAFVPVAVFAALSAYQWLGLSQDHAREQLRGEAGHYARGLYERLLGAHLQLGAQAAARTGDGGTNDARQMFRGIEVLPAPSNADQHAVTDVHRQLARGESALVLEARGAEVAVKMLRVVDPAQRDGGMVAGELAPGYLWGTGDGFSDRTQTCVLTAHGYVLFCPALPRGGLAGRDIAQAVSSRAKDLNGWQLHSHALLLRDRFGVDDWTVVTLRPPGLDDAAWWQLAYASLGVFVLTLSLVAFLSVVQIRRTLVPLEGLLEATRRIARQDFRRPVKIERDDEFGQLAQGLNRMAIQLATQITTMRVLSEIDQEILSRVDMSEIITRVQERLHKLWPNAVTGMVVFDQKAADFGIVHLHSGQGGVTAKLPTRLEPWLMERLARDYDGLWFDVGGTDLPDFLAMMVNSGAVRILVLPIHGHEKVNGLLIIGLRQALDFDAQQIRQARDLGNRIGVAMAAHARDEELKYRAYHDGLTGLPNRPLLIEHLNQEMAHARRSGKQVAVVFMDLDRFKNVNDSMGHDAGDRLLCQVAERLASCTRDGDTVARLGGDEFVVLLPGLADPQQAARLAEETMRLVGAPFLIDGTESYIGVSVGVAIFPDDGALAAELLKKADMAMYRAKATGRGRVVFFEENMNVAQQERVALERDLRKAIAREQLGLHFEPRFRLKDDKLRGAEALLRWRHPERGWVPSDLFMPLAEEIGLMEEIGAWMLREVCEQQKRWRDAGYRIDVVTVNVTPGQLKSGGLVRQVEQALQDSDASAAALEVELSEGTLGEKVEDIDAQLRELKRMGVVIALDDFGTGHSSLSNLQRLPIDVLKIAPEFVRELGRDTQATSIVYAILTLAHALGKTVLAQGVEQARQADLLRDWGCEQAQGPYFSRPLTASELEEMMSPSRPAEVA